MSFVVYTVVALLLLLEMDESLEIYLLFCFLCFDIASGVMHAGSVIILP